MFKASNFRYQRISKNLSVQDILIRSSNIGTLIIAEKLEKENLKNFLMILIYKNFGYSTRGSRNPIQFDWNKCKLETVSYGHGITTTPLQAATVYAS